MAEKNLQVFSFNGRSLKAAGPVPLFRIHKGKWSSIYCFFSDANESRLHSIKL